MTLKRAGKLMMPVVAVRGTPSTTSPLGETIREVAENVSEFRAPRTGHWIAEENPQAYGRLRRGLLV